MPPAHAAIVEPPPLPFETIVFPQRDFVSVTWSGANKNLTFDVTRNNVNIGHAASDQADAALPDIATDAEDILEVNHPGGLCWAGSTPDLLPGDKLTVVESGTQNGVSWTTLDITAEPAVVDAAGNVVIHGVARNLDGTAMDLSMVEQRIISGSNNSFAVNGKRDIRATSDGDSLGLITADPAVVGGWTATYTGLNAADQARAIAGETRGMAWQATDADGNRFGVTIYEAGLTGGPGMPECPAAAVNSVASAAPGAVNATNIGGGLTLTGASFNSSSVTVTLSDGVRSFSATGTPNTAVGSGSYSVHFDLAQLQQLSDGMLTATSSFVTAGGTIPGSSMRVEKDVVAPAAPTTDTAPGTYAVPQSIRLNKAAGEAASSVVHYTTDGSAPNALSPTAQPISVTSSRTIRAVVVDSAGNSSVAASFAYTIGAAAPGTTPPGTTPPGTRPPGGAAAVIPLAPSVGKATSGKAGGAKTATAHWKAPKANGAVRSGYEVRALKVVRHGKAKVHPAVVAGANLTKLKLTLPAGKYQFQVRATSAAGKSPWSAKSNTVRAR